MADVDGMEDNVFDDTIHPDKESDGQTNIYTDEVTGNELKEDDKSVNKPAQTQNKAVVSDQSNKLKEKLKGEGLDPEFWSNELKTNLGITCSESLVHVSPKDLKKLRPFRYDWEEAALLKLV